MRRKGRFIAWCTVVAGVGVLAVCLFSFRRRIWEEWHLFRLRSGDEQTRVSAIEGLGRIGSQRAIEVLFTTANDTDEDARVRDAAASALKQAVEAALERNLKQSGARGRITGE